MSDPERPALRYVDVKKVEHEGQPLFVLQDPFRLSASVVGLRTVELAIVDLLDGRHTLKEVAQDLEQHYGVVVSVEDMAGLVRALDEALFLRSERLEAVVAAWRREPIRQTACAGGGGYPDEAKALRRYLDETYTRPGGPGARPGRSSGREAPVRGVLSPHIDFRRGGHAYAHAWKAVAESCEAELFVVFGTAHHGTDSARFALTKKSYATPLGTIPTDGELVERLVSAYEGPDDLFAGEIAHKAEHSIEFQMVELAHLYGEGSPEPRKVRALPVLCGGLHDLIPGPKPPSEDARVRSFHEALGKALRDIPKGRVCFVGGVDLLHFGTDFGDARLLPPRLEALLAQDRRTLEIVTRSQDPDAFHADVAIDEGRKICGHAPIHATLEALGRMGREHKGEILCHDRWYDEEGGSSVSFCSVAFRDGKRAG
jgi:AmmeMemoRadiSam system protein B